MWYIIYENTVQPYKEGNPAVWMNLEDIMLSETNRLPTGAYFHLYEDSKIVKLTEARNRMVVARAGGGGWRGC